jgi:hypothetical protein
VEREKLAAAGEASDVLDELQARELRVPARWDRTARARGCQALFTAMHEKIDGLQPACKFKSLQFSYSF